VRPNLPIGKALSHQAHWINSRLSMGQQVYRKKKKREEEKEVELWLKTRKTAFESRPVLSRRGARTEAAPLSLP